MQPNGASLTISPTQTTTYYVHLTQGCEAVDSITIRISPPMEVSVSSDTLCGSVELRATTTAINPVYTWTVAGHPGTFTGPLFTVDKSTGSTGTVTLTATSPEGCPSDPLDITYELVEMTTQIKGSPSVCPGNTTELSVQVTTTGAEGTLAYQWYKDGILLAGETGSTVDAGPGTYKSVVSSTYCIRESAHDVSEGNGELKGSLTVNGEEILTFPRIYGSCGEEQTIVADYVTTGPAGFQWSSFPADASLSGITGNTITVQPTVDTEYYLRFENECTAYDTIRIQIKPQATLSVAVIQECEKTIVTASTGIPTPVYNWVVDGVEQASTSNQLEIPKNLSAHATVATSVHSAGYCPSEPETTIVTIDTLGLEISAPSPVCAGSEVELSSSIETSATQASQYQWSHREAGSSQPFTPLAGAQGPSYTHPSQEKDTEYRLTVTSGSCTVSRDTTVTLHIPERTGTIRANGELPSPSTGIKTHKSCGLSPVELTSDHTHTDAGSFRWSSIPADPSMSPPQGTQITADPSQTTLYILEYENQCKVTDTIRIEIHPLSVTADWSGFTGDYCSGDEVIVRLSTTGYRSGDPVHTIRWFKDDTELIPYRNHPELELAEAHAEDSGIYRYEVSNGVCVLPLVEDEYGLLIKPYAQIELEDVYRVIRGNTLEIVPESVSPADAQISWDSPWDSQTGSLLHIENVENDSRWQVSVTASDYCPAEDSFRIEVEGRLILSLTSDKTTLCLGDSALLVSDTTGTGRLLTPSSYHLLWEEKTEGGIYHTIPSSVTRYMARPWETTTYRLTAVYESVDSTLSQSVSSQEIRIEVYSPATYELDYPPVICEGSQTEIKILNLSPPDATISWLPDGSIEAVEESGQTLKVRPPYHSGGKEYIFTINQSGGCTQEENVRIEVELPFGYILPGSLWVCEGEEVELHIEAPAGTSYLWKDHEKNIIGTTPYLHVKPSESTSYEIELHKGTCPSVIETLYVEVSSLPRIALIEAVGIRDRNIIAASGYGTPPLLYGIDDQVPSSDSRKKDLRFGSHIFYIVDAQGCRSSGYEEFLEAPRIYPPVHFTPNGDGLNDRWEVVELGEIYPEAVVKIFDRFGKKLTEYRGEASGWDGTYLGREMPSTDYWYEIDVPEINETFIGHFTLIRR
jgi:gliding motility-associated-like protein